jgi:hypothetical protein
MLGVIMSFDKEAHYAREALRRGRWGLRPIDSTSHPCPLDSPPWPPERQAALTSDDPAMVWHPLGRGKHYSSMPQRCSVGMVRGAAPTGTMKVPTTTASVSGSSFLTRFDASGPSSKNVSPDP